MHFRDCSFAPVRVTVEGFVGGLAVFPCSIKSLHKTQDVNVHWRDSNGKTVYDITGGSGTVEKQALEYKNRVESERDNCSIKLDKLKKNDEGHYYGYITEPWNIQINVVLLIIEKPGESWNLNEDKPGRGWNQENLHVELTSIATFLATFFLIGIIICMAACFSVSRV